jgi:sigma-E factor negative regulatory protein RseA
VKTGQDEVMDRNMDDQELISALADGHLQGEAFARGVEAATADARARQAWCAYHVGGKVLRTGFAAFPTAPEVFLARLQQRLKDERPYAPAPLPAVAAAVRPPQPAANDWLWKLAAGVASVAAMTAVGWNVWGGGSASPAPQLAAAPAASAPTVAEANATMIRDPRLDELLAAHRQFGGATVLQSTSGFLRNATFDGAAR